MGDERSRRRCREVSAWAYINVAISSKGIKCCMVTRMRTQSIDHIVRLGVFQPFNRLFDDGRIP